MVLIIDRAGIVGEDGVTHQGLFDIAYLRSLPHLVVMAPKDGQELEKMLEFALKLDKPVSIRYPKSVIPLSGFPVSPLELGKAEVLREGGDFALVALGSMVEPSLEAIELLEKEGLKGTLINARFIKPLDIDLFKKVSTKIKAIFTIEEGVLDAGFGSALQEGLNRAVYRLGLPLEFIAHGKRKILLEKYGLDAVGISQKIKQCLR